MTKQKSNKLCLLDFVAVRPCAAPPPRLFHALSCRSFPFVSRRLCRPKRRTEAHTQPPLVYCRRSEKFSKTNFAYYGHTFPRRLFQTRRGSTLPPDSSPPCVNDSGNAATVRASGLSVIPATVRNLSGNIERGKPWRPWRTSNTPPPISNQRQPSQKQIKTAPPPFRHTVRYDNGTVFIFWMDE